jgi:ABC-type transporter MlaC component
MRILIAAAMISAFAFSPASAAMMACTADNMMKSTAMMQPGQTDANKEMAMANTDMSNGKMKSACMHYMKAQKMGTPNMGMMK